MSMEKESRMRSPHRRTGRENHIYIISSRKTMEIVDQLLSGEGTLLTNDSEELKRGLYFLLKTGNILCQWPKKEEDGFWLHCLGVLLDMMILVGHFQLRIFNDSCVIWDVHPTSSCWQKDAGNSTDNGDAQICSGIPNAILRSRNSFEPLILSTT